MPKSVQQRKDPMPSRTPTPSSSASNGYRGDSRMVSRKTITINSGTTQPATRISNQGQLSSMVAPAIFSASVVQTKTSETRILPHGTEQGRSLVQQTGDEVPGWLQQEHRGRLSTRHLRRANSGVVTVESACSAPIPGPWHVGMIRIKVKL